jgi:hypothetical protein
VVEDEESVEGEEEGISGDAGEVMEICEEEGT